MSSTYDYYGWDLLHKTVCSKLENEFDIILVLAHWFLTKNALFRCIGIGDDVSSTQVRFVVQFPKKVPMFSENTGTR